MVNLIKKFGVENFKKAFLNQDLQAVIDKNGNVSEEKLNTLVGVNIMFDVVGIIVENLGGCKKEIYAFIGNISNLKDKELDEMPMDVFAQLIIDVLRKEELKSFFGVVFKLLK